MSYQDGHSVAPLPSPQHDARYRPHHASTPQHSPLMPPMRVTNTELRHDSLQGTISSHHSQPQPIHMPPPTLDMRASRPPLGPRSILNPQPFDGPSTNSRRRSASQMESPSPIGSLSPVQSPSPVESGASSLSLPPISRPSSRGVSEESSSSISQPRRILSPRSPSLHRSQSMFLKGPETGSIDAKITPFLSFGSSAAPPVQRPLATKPGPIPHPRIHTPPVGFANRPGYYPRAQPTPPPLAVPNHHRRSLESMQSDLESHSAHASPRFSSRGSSQLADMPPSRYGTPVAISGPPMMEDHNPFGIPVVSTAQSNYQLLTLETQQGQIRIPVDVQAASKMADEKRKRNAGASARFRARRKEKEKEASETIAKLEQDLKEKEEDLEFYRGETNALTSVLYNTPATSSLSSRHGDRRSEQPSDSERNVRRRTSAYVPPTSKTEPIAAISSPLPAPGSFQGLSSLHAPQTRDMGPTQREVSPRTVVPHERFLNHPERTWSLDSGRMDRPQQQ